MQSLNGQSPAEVYASRAAFANSFAQRAEFLNKFGAFSNADYVAALLNQYGLTSLTTSEPLQPEDSAKITLSRAELVARLDAGLLTRAQVLRAISDSDEVFQIEFNRAFVAMQYYGYLRRAPEPDGYNAWLTDLNAVRRISARWCAASLIRLSIAGDSALHSNPKFSKPGKESTAILSLSWSVPQ